MKRVFNSRPLAAFAMFCLCGVFATRAFGAAYVVLAGLAVFAALAFLLRSVKPLPFFAVFAALMLYAGAMLNPVIDAKVLNRAVTLTGRIADAPEVTDYGQALVLDTVSADGGELGGRVRVGVYGKTDRFAYGQVVSVKAELRRPDPPRNLGTFDYRTYYAARGLHYVASADASEISVTGEGERDIWGVVLGIKESAAGTARELFGRNAGIVIGLLLGGTEGIDPGTVKAFRETGLAHLLAVSGLQVAFIAAGVYWLLKKLRNAKIAIIVFCTVLFVFCALCGFTASVARAAIMAVVVAFGKLLGRRQDTLTSMGAAMLIILFINPLQAFEVGFQLSFAAVFGIVALYPQLMRLVGRLPLKIGSACAVTLSAQAGVFMLSAHYFNSVSLVSPVLNILIVPAFSVITALCFAAVALGAVFAPLGVPFAFVAGLLIDAALWLTGMAAGLPFSSISVGSPPVWAVVAAFAAILAVSPFFLARGRIKLGVAAAIIISIIAVPLIPAGGLRVTMLDVGQGDAIIMESGDTALLIDAGRATAVAGYYADAAQYILKRGIGRLDVLLTHADSDHSGGLYDVLEVARVGTLYIPKGSTGDRRMAEIVATAERSGAIVRELSRGDGVSACGADITVLWPVLASDGNEDSLVVNIAYGGFDMLCMGDAGAATEKEIEISGETDIIKVAHHGSAGGTSELLLERAKPRYALISVGRNSYGHPSQATLKRLEDAGVTVLRTDVSGAIMLHIDEDYVSIKTMLMPDAAGGLVH